MEQFVKDKEYFRNKIKHIKEAINGTHAKIRELQESGADNYLIDAQCSYLDSINKSHNKTVDEWWKWYIKTDDYKKDLERIKNKNGTM